MWQYEYKSGTKQVGASHNGQVFTMLHEQGCKLLHDEQEWTSNEQERILLNERMRALLVE